MWCLVLIKVAVQILLQIPGAIKHLQPDLPGTLYAAELVVEAARVVDRVLPGAAMLLAVVGDGFLGLRGVPMALVAMRLERLEDLCLITFSRASAACARKKLRIFAMVLGETINVPTQSDAVLVYELTLALSHGIKYMSLASGRV